MYSLEQINLIEEILEKVEVKNLIENINSNFAEYDYLPNISDMLEDVIKVYKEKGGR